MKFDGENFEIQDIWLKNHKNKAKTNKSKLRLCSKSRSNLFRSVYACFSWKRKNNHGGLAIAPYGATPALKYPQYF